MNIGSRSASNDVETAYQVDIIRSYSEFLAIRGEWNDLLTANFTAAVWMRHEWIDCWWQAFGSDSALFIALLRQDGKIISILPMMIEKEKIKGVQLRVLKFIENGITPRSGFIMSAISVEKIKLFWDGIFKQSSQWDLAILNNMAHEDPGYSHSKICFDHYRVRYVECPQRISPYIQLSDGWAAVKAGFGKRLKRNLSNMTNRLSRAGEFSLVTFSNASDLPRALSICEEISRRSWKGEIGKDMSGTASRAKFYKLITAAAMDNGWATIWFLKLNDRLIAFEYGLAVDDHLLLLAIDYDLEFSQFSPGTVLRSLVLEELIKHGMATYDFAGTVYDYKLYWTKKLRLHSQFWVFHNGLKSRMLYLIKARLLPAIARLKSKPLVTDQAGIHGEDSSDAVS